MNGKMKSSIRKCAAVLLTVCIVLSAIPFHPVSVYGLQDSLTGIDTDYVELGVLKGFRAADTSPLSGALGIWGNTSNVALDYERASVGVDYFETSRIDKIELWDNDNASDYKNPSAPTYDYTVYISSDNSSYTQLTETTDWQVASSVKDGRLVHTFTFNNIEARYVKISTTQTGQTGSFALYNLQTAIKVYQKIEIEYTELGVIKGCKASDTTPTSGQLGSWGANDNAALDYEQASVGVDYFKISEIDKIELWDNDTTSYYKSASTPTYDYRIYISDDNTSYTLLEENTDWQIETSVQDNRTVHTFTFNDVEARYVKITTTAEYSNYSFTLSTLQTAIKVYKAKKVEYTELGAIKGIRASDTSPSSGALGAWGDNSNAAVDYERASVGVDCFAVTQVAKIELWDNNTVCNYKNGSAPTYDYTVYISDDNTTYTQLTETSQWKVAASIRGGKLVHTFTFGDISARYIKINTTATYSNEYSFVLETLQTAIKVYTKSEAEYVELDLLKGCKNPDGTPGSGALDNWGNTSETPADSNNYSIGVDYSEKSKIDRIELWDTNTVSFYRSSDATYTYNYLIYISDDNAVYTQTTDWKIECTIRHGHLVHTFVFGDVEARYVKIITNSPYSSGYSFALASLQSSIRVYEKVEEYAEPDVVKGLNDSDTAPASGSLGNWGNTGNTPVDYSGLSFGIDYLGVRKIDTIEIRDVDAFSFYKASDSTYTYDYRIYVSDDNATYTLLEENADWQIECTIEDGKLVHTFRFGDVEARFVKITTTALYAAAHSFEMTSLESSLKVYERVEYLKADGRKGSNDSDTAPASGALGNWNGSGNTCVDCNGLSIGVDYFARQKIGRIELWDNNTVSHYKDSDSTTYDYLIYISDDNAVYTQTTDWQIECVIQDGKMVHTFVFGNVTARYVKITTTAQYSAAHSFDLASLETSVRAYAKIEPGKTNFVEIYPLKGILANDASPTSGVLGLWGNNDGAAVDYVYASFGADYGEIMPVERIELWDNNSTSNYGSAYDYLVFVSDTNTADSYTQLTEIQDYTISSSVRGARLVHTFHFRNISARYVKITTNEAHNNTYSFILTALQEDLRVFTRKDIRYEETGASKGVLLDDAVPTGGSLGNFGANIGVNLDTEDTSIGIDLDGVSDLAFVEIQDSNTSNRLAQASYLIYTSSDNETYTLVDNWSFRSFTRDGKSVHQFRFYSAIQRYIKIATTVSDDSYTFPLTDLQNDVKVYCKTCYTETDSLKSALEADTAKTTGSFTNWDVSGAVYLDHNSTSIGIDYGERRMAGRIDLLSSETAARIGNENYEVYVSDDNVAYRLIDTWSLEESLSDGALLHSFYFKDTICRYVKITTDYADQNQTFEIGDLDTDVITYENTSIDILEQLALEYVQNDTVRIGSSTTDSTPASGALSGFGSTGSLILDQSGHSVGVDFLETVRVGRIELYDSNALATLLPEECEVYVSEDNASYTEITDWTLAILEINGLKVYRFTFNNVQGRYLKITTSGTDGSMNLSNLSTCVKVYDSLVQSCGVGGLLEYDTHPDSGRISNWGKLRQMAVDYHQTSIAMDLGAPKTIRKIELINAGSSTRLQKSNYSIYISNDNEDLAYTEVENWEFYESITDGHLVHTFILPEIQAQYVKIANDFSDSSYTFVTLGEIDESMLIYTVDSRADTLTEGVKQDIGKVDSDKEIRHVPVTNWSVTAPIYLDTTDRSIAVDLGFTAAICRVELTDSDTTDNIPSANYKIFVSEDNEFYSQIQYWNYYNYESNGERSHVFTFSPDTKARYIKIYADQNNNPATFEIDDLEEDIRVYLSSGQDLPACGDVPTQKESSWTDQNKSILIDFGAVSPIHKAEIVNTSISQLIDEDSFELYKSDDGTTFTAISEWSFSKITSTGELKSLFEIEDTDARYLKIKIVDGNEAGFVIGDIDGDVKGYANSFTKSAAISSTTYTNGVTIDFGGVKNLDVLEISNYSTTNNPDISDVVVTSSKDGTIYTAVQKKDYRLFTDDGVPVIAYDFNGLEARYVRVALSSPGSEQARAYAMPILTPVNSRTGVILEDTNPGSSAVSNLGAENADIALDSDHTSIVADLNASRIINRIEIFSDSLNGNCDKSDFDLLYSSNNTSYVAVDDWLFTSAEKDGRLVYVFEFAGICAQYFKIHYNQTGGDGLFVIGDIRYDVRTYAMKDYDLTESGLLEATLGYREYDRTPETGAAGSWGYDGNFEFDRNLRSVVADLGSVKAFNTIKIYDADSENTLNKEVISIYVSSDNSTYTEITGWDLFKKDNVITIYNFSSEGRYVKIHQHFNITRADIPPTFTARSDSFQSIAEIYEEGSGIWTLSGGNDWDYSSALQIDNNETEDVFDRTVYITKTEAGIPNLLSLGRVQTDLDDIRFVDSNDKELSFYESDDGFYVRIPYIAASGSVSIDMYYGNPDAMDRSDGESTFHVEYGTKTYDMPDMGSDPRYVKNAAGDLILFYGKLTSIGSNNYNIFCRKSIDNGMTWGTETQVGGVGNYDSPGSAVLLPNGDILLFFLDCGIYATTNSLSVSHCPIYYVRSTNGGTSWSSATLLPTGSNYCPTTSNPLVISTGIGTYRILVPYSYVYNDGGAFRGSVMYSDDNGVNWTKSDSDIQNDNQGFEGGVTELGITELANGDLKVYYRVQDPAYTHLGESISSDHGETWSACAPSIVYAPNTQPTLMRDGDAIDMIWSGNNSFNGISYKRAPLNIAYSTDDTASWSGYKDVLAGTPLWLYEVMVATQSDMILSGDGSLNVLWAQMAKCIPTLRIENFEDWLYKSFGGGYNDFETENMLNSYWWKLSSGISISKEIRYKGQSSLHLNDSTTNGVAQAARSFTTGIRKGSVKFKLYADNLDSEFNISLRECYSASEDSPGNMFHLNITSGGALRYKYGTSSYADLPTPTTLSEDTWYDIEMRFNTANEYCEIFVNGVSKGEIEMYMSENILNYLYISSGTGAASGTSVYIDELIIMDNSVEMPVLD